MKTRSILVIALIIEGVFMFILFIYSFIQKVEADKQTEYALMHMKRVELAEDQLDDAKDEIRHLSDSLKKCRVVK